MAQNPDAGMIDLGKPMQMPMGMDGKAPKGKPKLHYPTLFINDIPELDNLPDGEFYFMAKGQVTKHTEENPVAGAADDDEEEDMADGEDPSADGKECSCEITVLSMKPVDGMKSKTTKDAAAGLDSALTAIESKKADDSEDLQDNGADEDTETT